MLKEGKAAHAVKRWCGARSIPRSLIHVRHDSLQLEYRHGGFVASTIGIIRTDLSVNPFGWTHITGRLTRFLVRSAKNGPAAPSIEPAQAIRRKSVHRLIHPARPDLLTRIAEHRTDSDQKCYCDLASRRLSVTRPGQTHGRRVAAVEINSACGNQPVRVPRSLRVMRADCKSRLRRQLLHVDCSSVNIRFTENF